MTAYGMPLITYTKGTPLLALNADGDGGEGGGAPGGAASDGAVPEAPPPGSNPGSFVLDGGALQLLFNPDVLPRMADLTFAQNKKVMQQPCGCEQRCVFMRIGSVTIVIHGGGTAAEQKQLEAALLAEALKALSFAPKEGIDGARGVCPPTREGTDCAEECPKVSSSKAFRISISGQLRLESGAVADFSGYLVVTYILVSFLWRGKRAGPLFYPPDPSPSPPLPARPRDPVTPSGSSGADDRSLPRDPPPEPCSAACFEGNCDCSANAGHVSDSQLLGVVTIEGSVFGARRVELPYQPWGAVTVSRRGAPWRGG